MNIAEILKDCPEGTKLYSPLFGEVEFERITDDDIIVVFNGFNPYRFYPDGIYWKYDGAECLLFPSKDNRDWSTFKVPKKVYNFKPFDKVLVRDYDDQCWRCSFFSSITEDNKFYCCGGLWNHCIPFGGNEHLVGTTKNPE